MKRSVREAFVVVFVLSGIALGIFAYYFFSGHIRSGRRAIHVVMFDDVTGMRVGDPVEVQGLPKGRVDDLRLAGQRIECRVSVDRDVPLTEDTRFAIRSVSYLGSDRYLMVTLGAGPPAGPDHRFEGANEALNLEETFLRLDRMMGKLNPEELTTELRKTASELADAIREELARFSGKLGQFSSGFDATVGELHSMSTRLDSLVAMFNRESSAGRLLTSDELYQEVRKTNMELQGLITDFKTNPKRYIKLSIF